MNTLKRYKATNQEIRTDFTHYALMFGVVPVYYNKEDHVYLVRNWFPRFLSELVLFVVKVFWIPVQIVNPSFEPKIWFYLGKKTSNLI